MATKKTSGVEAIKIRRPKRHRANSKECALMLLHLIDAKQKEMDRPLSRFCVSSLSLERMWGRSRITPKLTERVAQWLLRAGRIFFFAGDSYGVILISAVEGWARLSSKRISAEIEDALAGDFDFSALEHLLVDASEVDPTKAGGSSMVARGDVDLS